MPDHLAKSIQLAAELHEGQVDKGGQPYILHSLHVMNAVRDETSDEAFLCAAVLHDVIEDTPFEERGTIRRAVYAAAGDVAGEAVDALTRGQQESWANYIDRLCHNEIARRVKMADLQHNSDVGRLGRDPEPADDQRCRKYAQAQRTIKDYERRHECAAV